MLMLSIDTATLVSTVALATPERLIGEFTLQTTKTHSEKLLPTIDTLCRFAGIKAQDIEAIAVSTGPGSFTGLRIGLATAKALSYANSLPLIGVPTLLGLAYNFAASPLVIVPVLDAQNLDTPPTQTTHPGVPLVLLLLTPIVPHIVYHADPAYLSAQGARRFKQEIEMQSPPQNYPPHTHPTMVPAAENQARALPAQQ